MMGMALGILQCIKKIKNNLQNKQKEKIMAKRFIDTKMWDKPWYRKLDVTSKLIWVYILTKCDHAGILDGDWEAASFFIGSNIHSYEDLPEAIRKKLVRLENEQFFIPSFIEYQYGVLRTNSKPHLSVIKRLEEKGLLNYLDGVLGTLKEKEKEKEKDIEKRKDKFINNVNIAIKEKKYKNDETNRFVEFWTEKNNSGTKMRFELEKTFEIPRRLATWVRNNREWKINKKGNNERRKMQLTTS